ncbi:YIPPEE family protein [Cryptosporidium andersoni]|uniref:Protein yippee-like n=1 Tax=Cryptosporidium andersoni TaxID=117008 RepID=A0A1J4MCM1_9CRYT|nr:YIPPEE family protein [Cryptosporidium andersoni]
MGRPFVLHLNSILQYTCKECGMPLSSQEFLISTHFRGKVSNACIFSQVYNVSEGPAEDRLMNTGLYSIVDIYCNDCGTILGWKYEVAYQESQQYKIGKYILERSLLMSNQICDDS